MLQAMKIKESLKIFLDGIIDYAGIFPPAKLPLKDAYENFLMYQKDDRGILVSNFICSLDQLDELGKLIKASSDEFILPLSIVCQYNENYNSDLNIIGDFLNENQGKVSINNLEIKVPGEFYNNEKNFSGLLSNISDKKNEVINDKTFLFYEGNINGDYENNFKFLIGVIEIHNEKYKDSGFKLRTGGVEAALFPTSEQVVYAMRKCLDRGVSFKATAGLHHPFRHYNDSVKTKMHGFINLFGAGIITYRHNITDKEMIEMLEEEDHDKFNFTDDDFIYRGWEISNDEIALARKEFMISFGSCSVDEPVDDLKKLGLIEE
jgi:hypothetical protein